MSQADYMIAKNMAKTETKGNLVSYNADADAVEVYVQVFFGYDKWKLGVLRTQLNKVQGHFRASTNAGAPEIDLDQYYAYFAFCILSGQVLPELASKDMLKLMKYDPQSVLEKSNLTSRVTKLVSSLRKAQVSSKARLITVWLTSDRKYLLDVLSLWFKEGDG